MLRILYVDDSFAQLNAFRQSLAGGHYHLWVAGSAREAEERVKQEQPELVIIDYNMPQMMGDACLKLLKQSASADTRFYLYTTDASAFRRHREMGFDGVLMLKGKASVRTQIDAIAKAMAQFRT